MGRTIPWLKDEGQKSKKATSSAPPRPIKRQRIQEQGLDEEEEALPAIIAPSTPRHKAMRRAGKSSARYWNY